LFPSRRSSDLLANDSHNAVFMAQDALLKTSSELESLSINLKRAPSQDELIELYERLTLVNEHVHQIKSKYASLLREAKLYMAKAIELARKLEKIYSRRGSSATENKARERALSAKKDRKSTRLNSSHVK